jgi:hypothetical protein
VQVHIPLTSTRTDSTSSRGFFLDLSPSVNDLESGAASGNSILVSSAASRTAIKAQSTPRRQREWWDEIETSLVREAPVIRAQVEPTIRGQIESRKFEWDTPEHPPNSPLCPLFQKKRDGDWE